MLTQHTIIWACITAFGALVLTGCPTPPDYAPADDMWTLTNAPEDMGAPEMSTTRDMPGSVVDDSSYVAALREALPRNFCSLIFDCPHTSTESFGIYQINFNSRQDCEEHILVAFALSELLDDLAAAIDTPNTTLDQELVTRCLLDLETLSAPESCAVDETDVFANIILGCMTEVVKGTLPEGSTCTSTLQCAGYSSYSHACERDNDECEGTCIKYDCAEECAANAYCDLDTLECEPYPTQGEPCLDVGFCDSTSYCDFELSPPVCQPYKGLDDPCDFGTCGEGLSCDEVLGQCVGPKPLASPCEPFECQEDLRCESTTNMCILPLSRGDACDAFSGEDPCEAPYYCSFETNTCTDVFVSDEGVLRVAREGEQCADLGNGDFALCETGLYCTNLIKTSNGLLQGTCSPHPKQEGSSCLDDFECAQDRHCINDTCITPYSAPNGSPCLNDDYCQSRNCDARGACAPQPLSSCDSN